MNFTKNELEIAGFSGWLPFAEIQSNLSICPPNNGVYVVTYGTGNLPAFLEESCGGRFKGRDPSAPIEQLAANWVDGAEVVYIGKGDPLRRRLKQFADFGAGKPIGHWGGRLIWQLPRVADLLVAWKETPDRISSDVEAELIRAFRSMYGKPPFANAPQSWGK